MARTSKASLNISIDPELKELAKELFEDLGMDINTAITVFLRQSVREQGIPFHIERTMSREEVFDTMRELYEMEQAFKERDPDEDGDFLRLLGKDE